jgi:hypothetical protein
MRIGIQIDANEKYNSIQHNRSFGIYKSLTCGRFIISIRTSQFKGKWLINTTTGNGQYQLIILKGQISRVLL